MSKFFHSYYKLFFVSLQILLFMLFFKSFVFGAIDLTGISAQDPNQFINSSQNSCEMFDELVFDFNQEVAEFQLKINKADFKSNTVPSDVIYQYCRMMVVDFDLSKIDNVEVHLKIKNSEIDKKFDKQDLKLFYMTNNWKSVNAKYIETKDGYNYYQANLDVLYPTIYGFGPDDKLVTPTPIKTPASTKEDEKKTGNTGDKMDPNKGDTGDYSADSNAKSNNNTPSVSVTPSTTTQPTTTPTPTPKATATPETKPTSKPTQTPTPTPTVTPKTTKNEEQETKDKDDKNNEKLSKTGIDIRFVLFPVGLLIVFVYMMPNKLYLSQKNG